MHAVHILHQHLRRYCPGVHVTRLAALLACVMAALRGQRITLTELPWFPSVTSFPLACRTNKVRHAASRAAR
jgi:hypothetical protein